MEIRSHPGNSILADLLCSQAKPRQRFELAKAQVIGGPAFAESNAALAKAKTTPPSAVMEAVLRDGYDYLVAQQLFGLFSPARKVGASEWALAQFRVNDTLRRITGALARAANELDRSDMPATLNVLLVPADPSNRNLMIRNSGLSTFGAAVGYLAITVWPSVGNLARLPAAAARAFALGLLWRAGRADTHYSLADALAAEGQAAALLGRLFPEYQTPWLTAHVAPPDWDADLAHIAALYGVECYDAVPANIYGGSDVAVEPPPHSVVLDAEERYYAQELLAAAQTATDPRTIAAHLYGDAIASSQGHAQAGLPAYAGFEIAFRSYLNT